MINHFSMFSGIGGFELGIRYSCLSRRSPCDTQSERAGLENERELRLDANECARCIGYSEIDKYAVRVYKEHFPKHKEYGDAKEIEWRTVPSFDLLTAGFPCQAFSVAGKRRGFSDARGTLFFEIVKCVERKRPRLLLLENVKGLLSHDGGRTFGTILSALDELGYYAEWQVLNSRDFGVPQNRERVFVVGYLRGTSRPQVFPFGESYDWNTETVRKRQSLRGRNKNTSGCLDTRGVNAFDRADLDKLSYDYEEARIRRLTPIEFERLQGFPDGWTGGLSDSQRYKCVGNAVTVNVIEAIMARLLKEGDDG